MSTSVIPDWGFVKGKILTEQYAVTRLREALSIAWWWAAQVPDEYLDNEHTARSKFIQDKAFIMQVLEETGEI